MTGCPTCGGYGNRHDPIAHGAEPRGCRGWEWGLCNGIDCPECNGEDEPFVAEDLCRCGHEHLRHDMGHGCIECRCRRFREADRKARPEPVEGDR